MTKKSFKEIKKEKKQKPNMLAVVDFHSAQTWQSSGSLSSLVLFFFYYETCSCSLIQEILIRQLWKGKATLAKEKCCVISCHEIPLILPQMLTRENRDYQKPVSQIYSKVRI